MKRTLLYYENRISPSRMPEMARHAKPGSTLTTEVLVTGGAGFIGSHLCEALARRGGEVRVLDNLSSGSQRNLAAIKQRGLMRFIRGDCKNTRHVKRALSKVEVVYHFAANPEVRLELTNPATCYRENVRATHVLLEAIRRSNVGMMVFASTSTVYGDARTIPTPENYAPLEPISIYGASKLAAEALITAYCRTYGLRAVILRFANIVGARSNHGVVPDFVHKLRKDPTRLEILGDGKQRKSYLHVEDAVTGILKATQAAVNPVEVYNVGSSDQITVAEIARIIAEELRMKDVCLEFTGGVDGGRGWAGDVKNMLLDTRKLESTGWTPRYNSQQSIRQTVGSILRLHATG